MSASDPLVMIPSTTSNGCWLAPGVSDVALRSRTAVSAPGSPDGVTTRAPATLPTSALAGLSAGTCSITSASTFPTANGNLRVSVASATPVTTTWLRRSGSRTRRKSAVTVPLSTTVRVCGVKPM